MSLKDFRPPKDNEKMLYSFLPNGQKVEIDSKILKGIACVHKITGEAITCYGFFPGTKYFGLTWYVSNFQLLKYGIDYQI